MAATAAAVRKEAGLRTNPNLGKAQPRPALKPVESRMPQAVPAPANDNDISTQAHPHQDTTDEQLVLRAQKGEALAFELLVRKYQHKTIQLVSRLVGEADAPDVAQEAFVKVYRALPGFRGQSAFYTWLYRIAVNTAKNHLVARSRRPANQDIDVADAEHTSYAAGLCDSDTPESNLLADEIRNEVTAVIRKLPPDLRQAIILREFEGLSYEEIAEVMNCPIGTVRSRIFRARESIDSVVKPLLSA